MEWIDGMQCSGVEWNGCILVILALLVILGLNLVVFCQTRKKVNFLTRRRHISAAYLTSLKIQFFRFSFFVFFSRGSKQLLGLRGVETLRVGPPHSRAGCSSARRYTCIHDRHVLPHPGALFTPSLFVFSVCDINEALLPFPKYQYRRILVILTLLVILGINLVVFAKNVKK